MSCSQPTISSLFSDRNIPTSNIGKQKPLNHHIQRATEPDRPPLPLHLSRPQVAHCVRGQPTRAPAPWQYLGDPTATASPTANATVCISTFEDAQACTAYIYTTEAHSEIRTEPFRCLTAETDELRRWLADGVNESLAADRSLCDKAEAAE